ncbi:MAG: hypothetical protein AAGA93_13095 [Actinomycetota bacterium]
MGRTRSRRVLVVAGMALAVVLIVAVTGPADATDVDGDRERHCVVEVTDVRNGVFVTGPETCFDTEAEVARLAGQGVLARSSGNTTIGVHYTSTGFGGSSITIVGTSCAGGVWYPTGSWNNNLESTRRHCGGSPTTFYDSSSCSGGPYEVYSQRTSLGSMNNKPSCVRYG